MRQRPLAIAGFLHGVARRVVAPHRRLLRGRGIVKLLSLVWGLLACMGVSIPGLHGSPLSAPPRGIVYQLIQAFDGPLSHTLSCCYLRPVDRCPSFAVGLELAVVVGVHLLTLRSGGGVGLPALLRLARDEAVGSISSLARSIFCSSASVYNDHAPLCSWARWRIYVSTLF